MPLVETDTIYAFLNKNDKNHECASFLFKKIHEGIFTAKLSIISLLELNYIYKKHDIESEFENDVGNLQGIKNIDWAPLNIKSFLTALNLYRTHNMSFYNCLHAGIAINLDNSIISEDDEFNSIPGLKRISLSDFMKTF